MIEESPPGHDLRDGQADDYPERVKERLRNSGRANLVLLDGKGRPQNSVDEDGDRSPVTAKVCSDAALSETLDAMLASAAGVAVIGDDTDGFQCLVSFGTIREAVC